MPGVARQMAAAGFEIGNHTWSHPDLTRRGSREDADQLSRTSAVIRGATGRQPRLMRPPYGARSGRVDRIARQQGLAEVLWSVDTLDWKHRNVQAVQDAVRRRVRRGSIVLLHDIHPTTVEAVPGVIAELRSRGYTLVTVSQLLDPLRPGTRRFSAG